MPVPIRDQLSRPVDEWTDYFVNYQSGNDVVCSITDQSANYFEILHAY